MTEHPNVTLTRQALAKMEAEGPAAMADFIADDVVWHEIGRAEPRRGLAEVAAAGEAADYEIAFTVHDVLASDDHVVVLFEASATRAGDSLEYSVAETHHLKDGKVIERWALSEDTQRIADFFA